MEYYRLLDTYYVNNEYANVIYKVYENQIRQKIDREHKKCRKTKKRFLKELVENADLYKSVLKKIMTTHR